MEPLSTHSTPDEYPRAASGADAHTPALGITVRIAKAYCGHEQLFDNFRLDLAAGETTCLLGPSGVGKSTLLRFVAGLLPISPDDCLLGSDGKVLTGRCAYMDQRDLLLPWLNVLSNVTLGARLRRQRADTEQAMALLEAVGLVGRERDLPETLSGGMRQRVALARTLMEERPVTVMDEPFSALDALTRHRVQGLAARLLRGRTVLLVTHDPNEALRLAHCIYVLTGRPVQPGTGLICRQAPPRDPYTDEMRDLRGRLVRLLGVEVEPELP